MTLVRRRGNNHIATWCPGCEQEHAVPVTPTRVPNHSWGYNGNEAAPTLIPSINIATGHYVPSHEGECFYCKEQKEAEERGEEYDGFNCGRCHYVLTDGELHFQDDCTHALRGQKIPLPHFPEEDPAS